MTISPLITRYNHVLLVFSHNNLASCYNNKSIIITLVTPGSGESPSKTVDLLILLRTPMFWSLELRNRDTLFGSSEEISDMIFWEREGRVCQ